MNVDMSLMRLIETLIAILRDNNINKYDTTDFYPHPNQTEIYFTIHSNGKKLLVRIETEPKPYIETIRRFMLINLRKIHKRISNPYPL